MIILIRAKDIESDSRVLKYITFLKENNIKYRIISWDRVNCKAYDSNTINFQYKASYNEGGWKAVKGRLLWMKFVVKTLRSIIKNNNDSVLIHACDLDTVFPAVVYKRVFQRKTKVLFDIFDWFSATLSNQNNFIRFAFTLMERFSVKNSDYIIICEKERIAQIPYKIKKDSLYVLPNIPSFSSKQFLYTDSTLKFNNKLLTVTYVGGLYDDRCLDEIISLAEKGHINLLIAGYGDERLEKRLKTTKSENIKYFGKVKYERGLQIMYNAEILYAMYSKKNPNHYFAAPNKYYEAMFLGKPIISTKGIILEQKILSNDIGYITEEDWQSIFDCIKSISRDDIAIKSKKSHNLWENKYKDYINDFLRTHYVGMLKDV